MSGRAVERAVLWCFGAVLRVVRWVWGRPVERGGGAGGRPPQWYGRAVRGGADGCSRWCRADRAGAVRVPVRATRSAASMTGTGASSHGPAATGPHDLRHGG